MTFIGYNEGRKFKHMVLLGTGLSFHYLTFVKLFIMLSDCLPEISDGACCHLGLLSSGQLKNLSEVTVQWRVKNLHHPPVGLHFPSCGSRLSSEVRDLARYWGVFQVFK